MELNREQVRAIKHGLGPLLIVAGAGTGKTTVVVERVKHIIAATLAKPSEVLALTFTEKAAQEMQARVDEALPYGYLEMWISTFHSFCDRILRREALHIGHDPKYTLLTQSETIQLIRSNLFKFDLDYFRPLGNPTKFVGGMLQHFSRLQDEDILPSDYLTWLKKSSTKATDISEVKKWKEMAGAFKTYEELKVKEGVMDFGDLIVKTLKLFRDRPNVLKVYQKLFKYVLVDEFQDTNIAQNELVRLLAGKNGNVTVVADDDQSIYRFRGAAVSNILQFRKNYPKADVVTLTKNYRSTQEILDKAYTLIQFNNPDRLEVIEKIDKKLFAQRKKVKGEIGFLHLDRVENEAEAVCKKIKEVKKNSELEYKDFAILVRANNHADPFARALGRHGIPHQFLGPGRLFKQPEVVDLISYIRILVNFEDSPSFFRLLSMDEFDINPRDIAALGNHARKKNLSLFEVAEKLDELKISGDSKERIQKIVDLIHKHLGLLKKESAGQILYYFLEEMNLLSKLLSPEHVNAQKKAANISKLFDKLKSYETNHESASVFEVCDWIDLAGELGESPLAADLDWTDINAVNILTVHSAKGLEFSVVFLVNLVSQRFPTMDRREQIPIPEALIKEVLPQGDYHIEEERRLFYVGMTRAKDKLFLTAANYYGEGKRDKRVSPFVFEALGEGVVSKSAPSKRGVSIGSFAKGEEQNEKQLNKPTVNYLSYSQIETFKVCPLHYKLKYIFSVPTPPTSNQSFGNSFHATMKALYEEIIEGKKPTEKLVNRILRENWINEGYSGKSHEKRSFEKATMFLRHYLKHAFNPKVLPVAMEQPFSIRLDGGLKVGGKIDRIDKYKDHIEIIDYKTGAKALTQKEADTNLQLSVYALAATAIPEEPFNKKPEEVRLSLYYFDTPQIVTTTRTKEQLDKARVEILDYKKQIESSDFTCSGNILCQNCEYKLFCKTDE